MKTAVEWLVQELHDNGYFHEGVPEDIVKIAEGMEKEQIQDAYENGVKETNSRCEYQEAEQYYNETFKSE
jgi:hypothetical protein